MKNVCAERKKYHGDNEKYLRDNLKERLCKANAEAKLAWTMPSRSQFSCKQVQSRTCSGYAERSRKCQEKVHFI